MMMTRACILFTALLTSIHSWAESPCIECQKAAQSALASCLQGAKSEADKKACNDKGAKQILACQSGVCKK